MDFKKIAYWDLTCSPSLPPDKLQDVKVGDKFENTPARVLGTPSSSSHYFRSYSILSNLIPRKSISFHLSSSIPSLEKSDYDEKVSILMWCEFFLGERGGRRLVRYNILFTERMLNLRTYWCSTPYWKMKFFRILCFLADCKIFDSKYSTFARR